MKLFEAIGEILLVPVFAIPMVFGSIATGEGANACKAIGGEWITAGVHRCEGGRLATGAAKVTIEPNR